MGGSYYYYKVAGVCGTSISKLVESKMLLLKGEIDLLICRAFEALMLEVSSTGKISPSLIWLIRLKVSEAMT